MRSPDPKIGATMGIMAVFPTPKIGRPLRIYQGGSSHRPLLSICQAKNRYNDNRSADVLLQGTAAELKPVLFSSGDELATQGPYRIAITSLMIKASR